LSSAENQFVLLVEMLSENKNVVSSQMFGKQCLKVKGKAFLALHKSTLVFKLTGDEHKKAMTNKGAVLWDPSGKGRPMKEWVAIPAESLNNAMLFANQALSYVSKSA
jgi:hypothetical protein